MKLNWLPRPSEIAKPDIALRAVICSGLRAVLAKPVGPSAPLGVAAIEDLVPLNKVRAIGIDEMLRDDALGRDHRPVQRSPVTAYSFVRDL
jgi:hypothetical protein